jgi:dTMP kinase
MEKQGAAFHARVREGFLAEAARAPEKIVVLSAAGSIDDVQAEIRKIVERSKTKSLTPNPNP